MRGTRSKGNGRSVPAESPYVEGDAELHQDPLSSLLAPLELPVTKGTNRVEQEFRLGTRLS